MNSDLMTTDKESFEMRIMLKNIVGSRMIEAVWVVNERVRERVALDGTVYVMDYGIANVVDRVTFNKRVGKASREVRAAIDAMIAKYPQAKPSIY